MGTLPAQSGIPAARLKVEAWSELTDYADPCTPGEAWVIADASLAAMASDSAVKSLLAAAVDKLKARCGVQLNKRPGGYERSHLTVRAVSTPDVETNSYGDLELVVAGADMPLSADGRMLGYNNQAAWLQQKQQREKQDQEERQANLQRLGAFFRAHQAQGWADLNDIAQNPFRYADRVVVTAARLDRVISPTRAIVVWGGTSAFLDGAGFAQWKPGARLLAVRVIGYIGGLQLQLAGSEACTQSRCADWLDLPVRLQDGQVP